MFEHIKYLIYKTIQIFVIMLKYIAENLENLAIDLQ